MALRRNYTTLSTEPDYIFSLGASSDLNTFTDTIKFTNTGNV